MTPTETATILRQFNEWRRSEDETVEQPDPREIGEAIDAAIAMIDRLEAAEKERDALRAKIEQMERQEPVGEIQRANSTGNYICSEVWVPLPVGAKLYALPGAKGEGK